MQTSESLLNQLNEQILQLPAFDKTSVACIGFDGFVDTIQRAVHSQGEEGHRYFNTISELASYLGSLKGKSGQVELISKKIKIGGNAPILSNALGKLGVRNTCLGAMGFPEIHPLFMYMDPLCHAISLAPPGKSNALEFGDGKIIFSELSVFDSYDWAYVKRTINFGKLRTLAHDCRLFAFVDWANLPHATSLWKGFLEEVIRPAHLKDALFLFDLCDPSKKSSLQIRETLDLINAFSAFGRVTLGLNENEANKLWMVLNGFDLSAIDRIKLPTLKIAGEFIYSTMNIETLLIHPPDRTLVFTRQAPGQSSTGQNSFLELDGKIVNEVAVLTGGGDNLNAGYCLGWLSGLDIHLCMLLGMAAAGAYIQNGVSPEREELIDYVRKWAEEISPLTYQENADVGMFL